VTQRNASAAEELASTAEELTAQAEALNQLMAFFRVSGMEEPGVRQPAAPAALAPRPPAARRPDVLHPALARAAHGGKGAALAAAAPADRDFTRF
jgi:methyl-accepting chemotaxis protein